MNSCCKKCPIIDGFDKKRYRSVSFDLFKICKVHIAEQNILSTVMLDYFYRRGLPKITSQEYVLMSNMDSMQIRFHLFFADEVSRILAAIDREKSCRKTGLRLYSSDCKKLGIRSVDAIHLRFSDIDWHAKQVHIFQSKTKKQSLCHWLKMLVGQSSTIFKMPDQKRPVKTFLSKHIPVNGYYGEFETNPYSILQKYLSRSYIHRIQTQTRFLRITTQSCKVSYYSTTRHFPLFQAYSIHQY